jgi:hypothetical protein
VLLEISNILYINLLMKLILTFFILLIANNLNAQVGINTTAPKASLDIVTSNPAIPTNTDGLLIPRVSNFPVTTPTADQNGMLIFLTSTIGNKTPGFYYWNNTQNSWRTLGDDHYIGEFFGGGIIFYVSDNGQHGLIVSLDDLDGGNGVAWSGTTNTNIGVSAQSFYDGAANTVAIVAENSAPNKAATLCDSYSNDSFTDWYLPSNWEINLLYDASFLISKILENDGDPTTNPLNANNSLPIYGNYWSSTERVSGGLAWHYSFYRSQASNAGKSSLYRVRAIRRF